MQAMKDAVLNRRGSVFVWMQDSKTVWIDLWFIQGIVSSKEFNDVPTVQRTDS